MRTVVPTAPVGEMPVAIKERKRATNTSLIAAFDTGFVNRIAVSMLGLGALLMLGVLGATQSASIAGSFGGGVVLGALLLKSQELFVKRVLGPRAANEKNLWARLPLGIVLPMKYVFIGAILGIAIEQGRLDPPALATGFILGQIVIVAKVVGRFSALRMRAQNKN